MTPATILTGTLRVEHTKMLLGLSGALISPAILTVVKSSMQLYFFADKVDTSKKRKTDSDPDSKGNSKKKKKASVTEK